MSGGETPLKMVLHSLLGYLGDIESDYLIQPLEFAAHFSFACRIMCQDQCLQFPNNFAKMVALEPQDNKKRCKSWSSS